MHAYALGTTCLGSDTVSLNEVGKARPGSAVDAKDAEEGLVFVQKLTDGTIRIHS